MISGSLCVWAVLCLAVKVGRVAHAYTVLTGSDGDEFRTETLLSDVEHPTGMAVDFTNNILYFSALRNEKWYSATLDLITRNLTEVKGLTGLCKFAVDQVLQQVHAGCHGDKQGHGGGLFQFDSNVDQFELTGEMGRSINTVYYNEVLYYTIVDMNLLYTLSKGRSARVLDMPTQVYGMVIDKDKNWMFYNRTGVYRRRAGAAEVTRYVGLDHPMRLVVNANGVAYAVDWGLNNCGLFRLGEGASTVVPLLYTFLRIDVTFDGDNNIIYTRRRPYERSIFRLVKY